VSAVGKSPKKPHDPDALDDKRIDFAAQLVLDGHGDVPRHILLAMLRRLRELLAVEMARRPAHRPATDQAGMMVDMLVDFHDKSPAEAKKQVAKELGKKLETVDTAYRRYLRSREKPDKTTR
jgi:hypothetical protein